MLQPATQPAVNAGSELRGKVALITGASRGIGYAIAEALAQRGADVVITARNAEEVERAAEQLAVYDIRVIPFRCDVRDETATARLMQLSRDGFGKLDVLVNNAGVSHAMVEIENFPADRWRETLDTNLTGTFVCTRAALPLMGAGGLIVNNVSVAAYQAFAKQAAYVASKWGLLGFTNVLREEVRARGIRVMALVEGATATDIWDQFWPEASRDRMMSPKDVAAAVLGAILTPPGTAIEEIRMGPMKGNL